MAYKVDILLATYNGESYIGDLLDSLLAQSYQDFRVLVRDDHSTDSTIEIISRYMKRFPEKIFLFDGEGKGPVRNFSGLMALSSAPYLMFCDQDDVWLPEKIEVCFDRLVELEDLHGEDVPLLVHSDLFVVDKDLEIIADSFWRFSGINGKRVALGNVLVQNVVTGCASMFNRALVEACGRIPDGALMHDWWVGLIAASMGHIGVISQPTILYRQHSENKLGAKEYQYNFFQLRIKLKNLVTSWRNKEYFKDSRDQAELLFDSKKSILPPGSLETIKTFMQLPGKGFFVRRLDLLRYNFFYAKMLQNLILFAKI